MKFLHIILDRDGVLNHEEATGWVTKADAWVWERGAIEGLRLLERNGVLVSVVTNQSCIGRGLATAAEVDALHAWVIEQARARGARIEHVLVCPHVDEDAVALVGIEKACTLVVGDSRRDLEAGRAAGLETALVRTGKGQVEEPECLDVAGWVFDDLHHAARCITGASPFPSR
jgi:D-glycero-D-manno-heptose 1,7-bisphosphate phosphatase